MKLKTFTDHLEDIARENSCASWKYYYEKNSRSERTIREANQLAAHRFSEATTIATLEKARDTAKAIKMHPDQHFCIVDIENIVNTKIVMA
jgi:hypothetical protein